MVSVQKWDLFFCHKFRFLAQKSDFCHTTPILVDDPFLALGMTVNFPPCEWFFDFPFPSYSCFRRKTQLTQQNIFPLPTVGGLPVTALALSAHWPQAGQIRLAVHLALFKESYLVVEKTENVWQGKRRANLFQVFYQIWIFRGFPHLWQCFDNITVQDKTSQELRMLSGQSLTLNVMITVSQYVRISPLYH